MSELTVVAKRARATIYPLSQTAAAVQRYLRTTPRGSVEGQLAVAAILALDAAEKVARSFPMDVTGL